MVTERELTEAEEEELASIVEGKIVGKMTSMNLYQIGIQPTDFKTIDQYVDDLVNYDLVLFSSYCHPDCYESGALEKGSSSQQGTWWTDAIGLDEAHEMGTDSREIKVGIIDDCFDYSHPDLLLESINKAEDSKEYMKQYFWENPFAAIFSREAYNEGRSHGTHVAGLIGAKDNGKGITGVYNDAMMDCIGYLGDVYDQYDNYNFLFQTDVLLRYEKCKVINLSIGRDLEGLRKEMRKIIKEEKENGYQNYSKETIDEYDRIIKDNDLYIEKIVKPSSKIEAIKAVLFIKEEIKKCGDFLIVQSAGNNKIDAMTNGYFAGIGCLDINSIRSLDEDDFYGWRLSEGAINERDLQNAKDRIIVVGAAENRLKESEDGKKYYYACDFSNYGRSVDIFAPGKDIYSTYYGGGYGHMDGTSMAAPIVSGSAAYVWSVYPELSSRKVKAFLINSTHQYAISVTEEDKDTIYPMLSLADSVEETVKKKEAVEKLGIFNPVINYKGGSIFVQIDSDKSTDGQEWDTIALSDDDNGRVELWCVHKRFVPYAVAQDAVGVRFEDDGTAQFMKFVGEGHSVVPDYGGKTAWGDLIDVCSSVRFSEMMDLINKERYSPDSTYRDVIDFDILQKDIWIMKHGSVDGYEKYLNSVNNLSNIRIIAKKIKIRSTPAALSDNSNQVGYANNGEVYAFYETTVAEGYTWYRIGEDKWIADDGTWVEIVE